MTVRRALPILAAAAAAGAAALALTGAAGDGSGGNRTYRIVFDNAFGLVEGGDFRVGGVRAGQTTGFGVVEAKRGLPKAEVTAEIAEPGFADFREDASCEIRSQSLIGEYYVDCLPGSAERRLPTDGTGTVPVEQTASTIPADLVNNILRRPYRERFRLIVAELGTALAGRPDDLADVIRRAHPGLRETNRVLRVLAGQSRTIERFIVDADTVVEQLADRRRDVARWAVASADAAEASASRRLELAETVRKLPGFLDELRPTMRRLGELADEQTPLLADLQRAAPDLDTFFRRLGPFSEASRPALRSLGEASVAGRRAFDRGAEEVRELRALAQDAPPFAKPLRQFLQTMDDRRRAIENDTRAKATAPPAPDPTAIAGQGGFTGLEAIWNYFFWQTLSINMVDDVGHILRVGLTAGPCSRIRTDIDFNKQADRDLFEQCKQWLGPYLPGITAPDFTDPDFLAPHFRSQPKRKRTARREAGGPERRAPGEVQAPPPPGGRDISKPQLALPPELERLLGGLKLPKPPAELPDLPSGGEPAPDRLLDYLMRP